MLKHYTAVGGGLMIIVAGAKKDLSKATQRSATTL